MALRRTERERIERVVKQEIAKYQDINHIRELLEKSCTKLIRRELAKRDARVRRIVNKQPIYDSLFDGVWIHKARLLAALSGRKGKR